MGMRKANQRRLLSADVDWQPVLKQFSTLKEDKIIPTLAEYLWQTDSKVPLNVLEEYTVRHNKENHIKTAMIRLMATPEYQLC